MRWPRRSRFGALLVAVVLSLVAAACTSSPRPAASGSAPAAPASSAPAGQAPAPGPFEAALTMPWEDLHQRALAEGGTLACYCVMAQVNAEKIMPAFEARFPGVKIEHIDATGDKLVARVVAEARGGRVLADVFSATTEYILQVERQRLLADAVPPEAEPYPENMRGKNWLPADVQYIVAGWNTNLVRPEEAPRQFEDFGDPRWKGRLLIEPRDADVLAGLTQKLGSQDRAVEVLRRIAANEPEFHTGHSELVELLTSGQGAVCVTCYSHHFPPRMRRGAPLDYLLSEGVAIIVGTAALKDAPHPYTAMLWQRWAVSEEGQRTFADGGRTPAHPNVEPREKTRPERVYPIGLEESANFSRYERPWKDAFGIR
jgi:iron(III) transport system substrate-binding protein